ncbi:MAG: type III secretion system chaperone [Chlamydiota bacterium]
MSLDPLLELFCREFNIAVLPQKDKDGVYQLPINSNTQLSLSALDPGLYIFSKMMPIPKSTTQEALFIYLMRSNFLGVSTGGSAIGIDPAEQFLTLSFALSQDINYTLFRDSLEDFINYLDFWREEIVNYQKKIIS